MLGYSDSNKDGGFLTSHLAAVPDDAAARARWPTSMACSCGCSTAAAAPSGRGGGPSYEAILAQPPGSVRGQLRLTEQGEIIQAKYADPRIGRRISRAARRGTAGREPR